jgi:hypothetical protein
MNITLSFGRLNEKIVKLETARSQEKKSRQQNSRGKRKKLKNRKALTE